MYFWSFIKINDSIEISSINVLRYSLIWYIFQYKEQSHTQNEKINLAARFRMQIAQANSPKCLRHCLTDETATTKHSVNWLTNEL